MPNEPLSADFSTDTAGLYVHIPFCKRKCPYCDFYSITRMELSPAIIRSILAELDFHRESFPPFDTVYIGGGTPSKSIRTTPARLIWALETVSKIYRSIRDIRSAGIKIRVYLLHKPRNRLFWINALLDGVGKTLDRSPSYPEWRI